MRESRADAVNPLFYRGGVYRGMRCDERWKGGERVRESVGPCGSVSSISLSADRNAQQQASHHVSYPEILFGALRMRIMTADATLGDRYVRI